EDLCDRKQIVVANKCDIATKEQIDSFRSFAKDKGLELYEISAATTQGTENLVKAIAKTLDDLPPIVEYIPNYMPPLVDDCKKFNIEVKDGVYFVDAPWLDQILCKVNMDDYESLQYLQRVLRDADIIEKLENMGINEGDTVNLQGFEFDFVY
ncbi:MAG: Obg family GTPase CgtA, partial [Oscillospiraceae bacterium]|nr:Obg family GTPase CgtA [Oscillospiraceae bacterium]